MLYVIFIITTQIGVFHQAYSVDHDDMSQCAASDLGLHY